MGILLAFAGAAFAGVVAIFAKLGYRNMDSNLATALRTIVVLLCAWGMVALTGKGASLGGITPKSWLFLVLSGLATGASWLCYFRALQLGSVNKVTPVDKTSTILTILLAAAILGEALTPIKIGCVLLIALGTGLMLTKKAEDPAKPAPQSASWFFYALGSAVFASLTSILTKIGITGVDSALGTAIRTVVVLVMAWGMVLATGKCGGIRKITGRGWLFLALSGLATGGSWLCQNRALQLIDASVAAPIDKLSIVITVGFSYLAFGEKLSKKAMLGLALLVAGTLGLLIPG
ncbi:MAG: EamA family transporter [Gemmiger sp.]|nr:EamA family transporter [Gemmiger sp.]